MSEKVTKADQTREKLLGLALKEFKKKGFDDASMRDLASAADLSLGAFYYHFKNKEEIVQVYYERTFEAFADGVIAICARTDSFEKRLTAILHHRIETFRDHRELLIALSRAAVDPRSDLSPFGERQRAIREETIAIFAQLIESSDLKVDKKLRPYLPMLLWMYLMAVIFFWVFDESPRQKKTTALIDKLSPLISRLLRFSRFPLTGAVMTPVHDLLQTILD